MELLCWVATLLVIACCFDIFRHAFEALANKFRHSFPSYFKEQE